MVKRRIPRKPGRVEKPAPLLPTFVFARARHLPELYRITRLDVSPHPAFAIFHFNSVVARVSNNEIERLKVLELGMAPKRRRPTVPIGHEVRPNEGAYAGLTGVVQESDGKHTLVAFGGWMNVKIETSILVVGDVHDEPCS